MLCHRHRTRPARRRCYYCGSHICQKCQHYFSQHIFCSRLCYTRYCLGEIVKGVYKNLHNAAVETLRYTKASLLHLISILKDIMRQIYPVPISSNLMPAILVIITISSINSYISLKERYIENDIFSPPQSVEPLQEDDLRHGASQTKKEPEKHERTKEVFKPHFYNITRGRMDRKELSITFDGGSEDNGAKEILEILRSRDIKTTIFLTGNFIKKYPDLVIEMVKDGHEIGNHTFSHPHLTTYAKDFKQTTLKDIDKEFLTSELKKNAELFKETTGKDMSPLWRAPYGELNKEILQWAFDAGYIHVSWTRNKKTRQSLDSLDWVKDVDSTLYLTANEIKEKIINFDKNGNGVNGGIVLMHLGTERQTQEAHKKLEDIIDTLSSEGYRFVKVSQMMSNSNLHLAKNWR